MNGLKALDRRIAACICTPVTLGALALSIHQPIRSSSAPSDTSRLSWLAGCWVEDLGAVRVEDEWTRPVGHTILGVSRTLRGDSIVELELRTVSESAGRLVLTTRSTAGQARLIEDSLTLRGAAFGEVSGVNSRTLNYRNETNDQLVVRHERSTGGKRRRLDDLFDRASCGARLEKVIR